MIKLISILFLALIYWVLLFSMSNTIAQFAICLDKVARRAVKKWRRKHG